MPVVDDITQMIGCLRDGNLKEAQAAGQLNLKATYPHDSEAKNVTPKCRRSEVSWRYSRPEHRLGGHCDRALAVYSRSSEAAAVAPAFSTRIPGRVLSLARGRLRTLLPSPRMMTSNRARRELMNSAVC